jgi:hypothetical protein
MRLFATSWVMPGTLGFLYVTLGGELRHSFLLVPFKVNFHQSGVTSAAASATARGSLPPIPAQCACSQHYG